MLHVLPAGAAYDLTDARAPAAGRRGSRSEDAAELAEAQADLQQMARDIAAGDASPATLRRRLARKRSPRKTADRPTTSRRLAEQDGASR